MGRQAHHIIVTTSDAAYRHCTDPFLHAVSAGLVSGMEAGDVVIDLVIAELCEINF